MFTFFSFPVSCPLLLHQYACSKIPTLQWWRNFQYPSTHVCFYFFVWGFSSHSKIFHSYGDVTITGKGLQILTYIRHSWPLCSEGSLEWYTYCYTGHPLIMVISEDPWHSHPLPSVWQRSCHYMYLFLRLRFVAAGIRTPNLLFAGRTI